MSRRTFVRCPRRGQHHLTLACECYLDIKHMLCIERELCPALTVPYIPTVLLGDLVLDGAASRSYRPLSVWLWSWKGTHWEREQSCYGWTQICFPRYNYRVDEVEFLLEEEQYNNIKLLARMDPAVIVGLEFDSVHHATVVGLGTDGASSVCIWNSMALWWCVQVFARLFLVLELLNKVMLPYQSSRCHWIRSFGTSSDLILLRRSFRINVAPHDPVCWYRWLYEL